MTYEREQLQNSPLVEALVEVRAECKVPYALVPGGLNTVLVGFPRIEESGNAVLGPIQLSNQAFHRFRSEDGHRLIQCGPGLFTANIIGDYGEYSTFEDLVRTGFEAFQRVAVPQKILRVGVRYINHLRADLLQEIEDPINLQCIFPREMPTSSGLNMRGLFPYKEGTLGFALANPHELADGSTGCLLDYDFYVGEPSFENLDDCLPWIRAGHDIIYQAFRSTISEALHECLKGVR